MGNMESGFGWDYPPGTPGPRTEYGTLKCRKCGHEMGGKLIHDLGAVDVVPEVCTECGDIDLEFLRDREDHYYEEDVYR